MTGKGTETGITPEIEKLERNTGEPEGLEPENLPEEQDAGTTPDAGTAPEDQEHDPEESKGTNARKRKARRTRKLDERELRRRRRKLRRTFNPTRVLLFAVMAALVIVFAVSVKTIVDLHMEKSNLQKENRQLKKEKAQLELELQKVNDLNYIEEQARKQLNMVKPGEILYITEDKDKDNTSGDKSAEDN